jgi:hypothetical protein
VQAAHDLLAQNGYNVEGTVVSPTADKLLTKKPLGKGEVHLPLESRARIADAQFPPEINGKPVEVHTAPGEEVEQNPGKPRRSDLAKWTQRQYPNHTVINVTGEDASVPGAPETGGPELYQGAKGTAHEGVNYLTVPRIGGHSSTAIREAIARGDTEIPGMSPDAVRTYREELDKAQAAQSAPVETGRQNRQIEQGARLAGHDGSDTTVLTPSGRQLSGRYRVVEGDTLTPSHNPQTFAKNPNYPEGVQERAYHSSKEAQMRVIDQSQKFDPRFILSDDPTGVNGPPIVTPDGKVLGGNSRVMTTERVYNAGGDVYKNALMKQAGRFGIDPEQVRGMKRPTLVREIDAPTNAEELRRIGSDLNTSPSGSLNASERAVSAGRSLRPESLQRIDDMQKEMGGDASLRELMAKRAPEIMQILQRDGLINDRQRPGMMDSKTGGLNEDGKNFVEKALIGSVVDDPDLMDRTPKNVLNKLGGSLGDLAGLTARSDEYNIGALLRSALHEHVRAAEQAGPFEDYMNQSGMFHERSAPVEALANALNGPVKDLRAALRSFAQDARADVPGQGQLGGLGIEKPSAAGAFNHAFKTNLSEAEFDRALRDAVEKERGGGVK